MPGGAARLSTSLLDFGLGGRGLSSRRIRRLLSGGLLGALGRLGRALLLDERGLVKQVRHALRERAAVRAAVHKARLRAPAATRASSACTCAAACLQPQTVINGTLGFDDAHAMPADQSPTEAAA